MKAVAPAVADAASLPMAEPVSLTTERLHLRPWRLDERAVLSSLLRDPETMRFWPALPSEADVDRWLADAVRLPAETGLGRLAVTRRHDGTVIGDAGLMAKTLLGEAVTDLGYIIHAKHYGHGYATEAAQALLTYGTDDLGLTNIVCHMAEDHTRSRQVAERIGLTLTSTFPYAANLGKTHLLFRL